MTKLNDDVIYLILKELYNVEKSFHSYLLVNKTWFCKHLDLTTIEDAIVYSRANQYEIEFFMNEITYHFVNDENTNITHLYIPRRLNQMHLIPGSKRFFAKIKIS
ncbi:hypothetical protein GLOIN_2v1879650 [Rhizophagus clarus]|uniref:Uncharacterized protein n=1 Tax=Rhizophagus clarus TaxID=94130 RepID=A0A8H3LJD7_9GLOM|nr:hypothetical protein GLOIN_2v1879650 [Rhizophagus clarus]